MKSIILMFLIPVFLFAAPNGKFRKEKKEEKNFVGSDIIGWSYNIFDKYASNESKKKPLFKFPEKTKLVILENITKHDIRVISGSNSHEYFNSLNVRLGLEYNSAFFGGSLDSSFGHESLTEKSTSFVTIQDYTWKWRTSLNITNVKRDIPRLKSYIIKEVQEDINTMNPEELFDAYGTHFIAKAYIGGRADYNATIEKSSKWSKTEIEANVKAQFKMINTSLNVGVQNTNTNKEISENSTTKLTVTGGNAEYLNNITNEEQYKKWAEGIKKQPVLCDFEKGSLMPIWTLADSDERKKQLENYFKDVYLLKYPLPILLDKIDGREIWKPTKERCFIVKNKQSGRYIDLSGMGFLADSNNGTKIKIHDLNSNDYFTDRVICFDESKTEKGFYTIKTQLSPRVFDISGDWDKNSIYSKYKSGAEIQLWDKIDNAAQQFQFEVVDKSNSGYIAIHIRSKLSDQYLQESGANNGDLIVQKPFTGEDSQIWHLEYIDPKRTAQNELTSFNFLVKNKENGKILDISGAGNCGNGYSVLVYTHYDGGADQLLRVVPSPNEEGVYFLEFQHCSPRKRVHLYGGWDKNAADSKYKDGMYYVLWEAANNDADKFYIQKVSANEFMIVNKLSNMALKTNGQWVLQSVTNPKDIGMIWQFVEPGTGKTLEFDK
ncbi:RICIN domain-containing protein [bacterium]|nr:RICIN domain-containing protein [bacterium]